MKFQYYSGNIKYSRPLGYVSLDYVLDSIKSPKPEIKTLLDQIKHNKSIGNKSTVASLKTKLYSFTPAVNINSSGRRRYADITSFTGLLPLDWDGLTPETAIRFKSMLFDEYSFLKAVWLSSSGTGVRAIARIPVCNSVDEFKSYYTAIERHEMGNFFGFDPSTQNCVLPMFISEDFNILVREWEGVTVWKLKEVKPEKPKFRPAKSDFSQKGSVKKIIASAVNSIREAPGHPRLRSAAISLGGYVGAGLIDQIEAEDFIVSLINCNSYLQKNISAYEKTAKSAIDIGKYQPLNLS